MNEQQKNSILDFKKVRKYFPIVLLICLTLALMIFFKFNKKEISSILEEGKNNILAFYAENLQPLLFQTTITNEDVFNFALFNSLPLDKTRNKVLEISGEQSGKNTFVIKTAAYNPATKNYQTFVKYMGMNSAQKEKIDSILNSYKKDIYSSVLVNDKNTYAVNPKISEVQQAALADIVSYAQSINRAKSKERFSDYFGNADRGNVARLIGSARDIPQNEYYLITPDTVARTYFKWDQKKFDKHLSEIEKNKFNIIPPIPNIDIKYEGTSPNEKGVPPPPPGSFSFSVDSNSLKFVVPIEAMNFSKIVRDSIRIKLSEAAKKIKNMSVQIGHLRPERKRDKTSSASEPSEVMINPYEIADKTLEMLSKNGLFSKTQMKDWQKFGEKMDSLSQMLGGNVNDSVKKEIEREIMNATRGIRNMKKKPKADSADIKR